MPVTVTMPRVSEAATEATIGVWLRQPGDEIAEGEPLLEIVSDKVTLETPAPASGVLREILAREGETVAVDAPIAVIALAGEPDGQGVGGLDVERAGSVTNPHPNPLPEGEGISELTPQAAAGTAALPLPLGEGRGEGIPRAPARPLTPAPSPPRLPASPPPAQTAAPVASDDAPAMPANGTRVYTPRVRLLAAEHGLTEAELSGLTGGGLGGRLGAADVLAYLERRPATSTPSAPAAPGPSLPTPVQDAAGGSDETLLPLTPMRRAIAAHMERSVATAPHGWMSVEIDMSAVSRARAAMRGAVEAAEGFGLTFLPFFAEAVIGALHAVPAANATWAGDELTPHHDVNLGVAVAIEGGLVVPVIPGADGLNMLGLARAIHARVERARAGRLSPGDMGGGTCTVNNTGAVGSVLSRPIINQPQVAIVTMEAIVRRPVVVGDEDAIAVRPLMNACLSYDERAVDAAQAAAFLAALRRRLEGWT
jgi:pyruvate/2-oxoglutarate dehydrogenase complex dihydrolipoamide acyltransferase (E2) component